METLLYVALAIVIYAVLADQTDRAVEREMRKRKSDPDLRLVS